MSADKKKGAADNAPVRVDPTKIHILRVNMVQGKLETTDEYLSDPKEPEGVRFGFGHRSGIDKERSQIYTRLFIDMEAQDGEGEPLGVKAAYVFDFELKVDNLAEFERKAEDGTVVMDAMLATTLMGILFGTARGMVLERTKGTYLNGVILPVIPPRELVNSWREE